MQRPSAQALPAELLASARQVALRVATTGRRAWIVGGPVRDLARGVTPHDLDMASALPPDEVEALFQRTASVGKAFGTMLVHGEGVDVQLTTFRRERGFSDARRPDHVDYSEHLEEDARRRDFTCNAMYLDPLDDELRDPEGGLEDIRARILRSVGEPGARFAEDGLRLVRLARFAAALDFRVDDATLRAASSSAGALAGVSAERRLSELERIFSAARSPLAIELLGDCQLLEHLLPGFRRVCPDPRQLSRRLRALNSLSQDSAPGSTLGLAVLLHPSEPEDRDAPGRLLEYLRMSRDLRQGIEALWRLEIEASNLTLDSRAALLRFARQTQAKLALRLSTAWICADGGDGRHLDALGAAILTLTESEKFPTALLSAEDLKRAAIPPGPRWRVILEALETEQLEGRLRTRDQALGWLEQRALE